MEQPDAATFEEGPSRDLGSEDSSSDEIGMRSGQTGFLITEIGGLMTERDDFD